jgi:hypothetical protein
LRIRGGSSNTTFLSRSACARATGRRCAAEDAITGGELGHVVADRLDLARELVAEDLPLRAQKPGDEPAQGGLSGAEMGVGAGHAGRADPDEDLVVRGHRLGDLLDPEDLRRPVPVVHDRLHDAAFRRRTGLPCFQRRPAR